MWMHITEKLICQDLVFYMYFFGRCSSELVELVPIPYSCGRSTRYSNILYEFSVTITRCYKDVYINSFL